MRTNPRSDVLVPILLTLVLAVTAACSSRDPEPTERPAGATASAAGATSTSGTTSTSGATGSDGAYADRLEDTVEIAYADRLLVGFDSVWVHTDDQFVHRLDPQSGETIAEIPVGNGFCQGSGLGEGAVWSCADNTLVRVDPETNEVDLETGIEMRSGQWSIGVGEGAVWIVDGETLDTLLAVDPSTGEVIERIPLGHVCSETAVAAGSAWVSCADDGVVVRVDPQRFRVTGEVDGLEGTEFLSIFPGADGVWVDTVDPEAGLAEIDGRSLELTPVVGTEGSGDTGAMWQEGDDLWVRSSGVFLTRIDAATHSVLERIEPPSPLGGGSVAVADGSVWASAYDFNTIVRLAS